MLNKLLLNLPPVKRFRNKYNPSLNYLLKSIGVKLNEKSIVIDVGANIGQTIDFFLSLNKSIRIHSFEPTLGLYKELLSRYGNYNNIKIYPVALSDFIGKANLYTSEYSPTNSLLKPNLQNYRVFNSSLAETLQKENYQECEVNKLDNWLKLNLRKDDIIEFCKTDTQGNDYKVLKGGEKSISKFVKIISIEMQYLQFYNGAEPFYNIFKLLYENDFYLFNYYANSKIGGIQLIENNALFLNSKFYPKGFLAKDIC